MEVDAVAESPLDGYLFVPRSIVGWRLFGIDNRGDLVSMVVVGGPYQVGRWYEAKCVSGCHVIPNPGEHGCGFYAFRTRKALFEEGLRQKGLPSTLLAIWAARVALAGRIVVHERGYRAQHMRIVAAWPLKHWLYRITAALESRGVDWVRWFEAEV